MPPGDFRSGSRRAVSSAMDCWRLSAMAAKCRSSPAINAGSALAVRLSGRENALVLREFTSSALIGDARSPAILRPDPGLAASPHLRYTLKWEGRHLPSLCRSVASAPAQPGGLA